MRRAYADTPEGQVHYATGGAGPPLLLLHHTPRSLTFYRQMMPALADHRRVIAMDTLGFGASDPAPNGFGIRGLADNVAHFLDALGVERAEVLGAMTGARIALELAVSHPARVAALVLMGFPFFLDGDTKARRREETARQALGVPTPDGEHVVSLWRYVMHQLSDSGALPPPGRGRPGLSSLELDFLTDWMVDALRAGDGWRRTALNVYEDDPSAHLRQLNVPTLVIGLSGSGFPSYLSADSARRVHELVAGSRLVTIEAPDADARASLFHADALSATVLEFLVGPSPS